MKKTLLLLVLLVLIELWQENYSIALSKGKRNEPARRRCVALGWLLLRQAWPLSGRDRII